MHCGIIIIIMITFIIIIIIIFIIIITTLPWAGSLTGHIIEVTLRWSNIAF